MVMINPWIRRELIDAAVIFASTSDTRNLFSRSVKDKAFVFTQVHITNPPSLAPRIAPQGPPRLLCIARLHYWKGVHIAISRFCAVIKSMPRSPVHYRWQRSRRTPTKSRGRSV